MPGRRLLRALNRENLVNRSDRGRVAAGDRYFAAARPIDRLVADRRASVAHHRRAGYGLRVYLEWFREVARAERGLNVPHVRADRRDRGGVGGILAIEDDTPPTPQLLQHMPRGAMVSAPDIRA